MIDAPRADAKSRDAPLREGRAAPVPVVSAAPDPAIRRPVDISVYVVLDAAVAAGRPLGELARAAVAGGATILQLRDKAGSTAGMVARAREIRAAIAGSGVPFVVNDRLDVALAAGADGVHLGGDDMAAADARAILARWEAGPAGRPIVGLSLDSAAGAAAAPYGLADYVCLQSVFATASKADAQAPIGLDGLADLAAVVRATAPGCPVGAIGGITAANAAAVVAAGVDGVAVISAVVTAPDPEAATRALAAAVAAGRQEIGR